MILRALLSVLQFLVYLKQRARPIARTILLPFVFIGRILFGLFGLPIYRMVLKVRRQLSHVYLPAKNRALYVVSNRYVFHVAVVGIAAITSFVNVQGSEVRAETFGEKSLLFSLANQDYSILVDEVAAQPDAEVAPSSYLDIYYVLDAQDVLGIDTINEDYLATTLGGGGIMAPAVTEESMSVAPRTETEAYVVQDGDTLGTISEQFGLNLSTVLWANSLTVRSTIKPGLELKIPPIDGVMYTVKTGDTLSSIAKKYNADADRILSFNVLSDADDLTVGETLMIPDGEPPAPVAAPRTAPLAKIFTSPSTTSTANPGGWVWPTDQKVITQYYGWNHTGLDIDGGYDNYNYASRGGTITRASWFGGYGLCVDIDHGDGYVTRYGHFARIDVAVGDWVDTGESLGLLGTTGRSTGTHLHFEIFENGKRRNPLEFIQ